MSKGGIIGNVEGNTTMEMIWVYMCMWLCGCVCVKLYMFLESFYMMKHPFLAAAGSSAAGAGCCAVAASLFCGAAAGAGAAGGT